MTEKLSTVVCMSMNDSLASKPVMVECSNLNGTPTLPTPGLRNRSEGLRSKAVGRI